MPTAVLVTGATGKQGGGVIDALLAKGSFKVYALTRKPDSGAAAALKTKGVTILAGDFTEKDSLEAALRTSKASQVFLVTDFWVAAKQKADVETMHGNNMIDAVKAVDPSIFVVYTSVGDADKTLPSVRHFFAKALVEKHLAATLQKWAVLRPCTFLENLDDAANFNPLTKGKVKMLTPVDTPMKYVSATVDVGKAAANVFSRPAKYNGQILELATCMHSGAELAEALSEASGTKCTYGVSLPRFVARLIAADVYRMMLYWEEREGGYTADVAAGRRLVGPDAMDAKAWFKHKGQWANGVKFGDPDPPSSAMGKAAVLVALAGIAVAATYRLFG